MCIRDRRYFAKKHWKTLAEIDSGLIFKALATFIINKKVDKDGIKDGQLIADVIKEGMLLKGIRGFRDLPINLSICTVDTLTTDECIFLTENEHLQNDHIHYLTDVPLDVAVRASMSFPAIYTTCDYGNYNFIDGGSKDNLPVKVLKDMGVGRVLAIGFDIMAYDPDAGLDGLIKVIWRALDVYSIDGTRKSQKLADLAIEIKNENTQLFAIDSVDETIQEGYDTIMAHKDEILRIFGPDAQ
ncbi:patatin-like phospholipase family protein, partial [Roseburia sp. MSJ-14]|uniref:patatin-like phospholipase family protein n=1 Tax=Roseburia sp. MSJ-14 TaxID=2841514 RepID=UPI001C1275F5